MLCQDKPQLDTLFMLSYLKGEMLVFGILYSLNFDFSFFVHTYTRLTMNFSVLLFLSVHCSYHWIKRKGKPAPREVAPIIVSNHVSYIEPIFYFYELFATIVASESHDSIPFVGTIIRAMQVFCFHGHVLCMQISNYKKLWYSTILCFIPLFYCRSYMLTGSHHRQGSRL